MKLDADEASQKARATKAEALAILLEAMPARTMPIESGSEYGLHVGDETPALTEIQLFEITK